MLYMPLMDHMYTEPDYTPEWETMPMPNGGLVSTHHSCTCLTHSIIEVARRVISLHKMSYILLHNHIAGHY